MASQPTSTDTPHLTMQININGRGAFLGAFAAIALAALTAAQLPSLSRTNAGGGYLGVHEQNRELWRFDVSDQIATGQGFTVPAGRELVILGVGGKPEASQSWTGAWASSGPQWLMLLVDGEGFAQTRVHISTTGGGTTTESFPLPGLAVAGGSVFSFGVVAGLGSLEGSRYGYAFGYLRDI